MTDRRNGGGRQPKPLREIPFSDIERDWVVTPITLGSTTHPAVGPDKHTGGHFIRVLVGVRISGADETTRYAYFRTDADGVVVEAPRGYAKDYKPARITGLEDAAAKYGGGS